jgi:hypothetical protein
LTDEEKSALAGEAKDCWEGSIGFVGGDNGGGLPLAIFEGSGGAAEDNTAVVYNENAMSPVDGRMVPGGGGGNEKPTFVDAERDAIRSEDADGVGGNEIGYESIDKEAGVINNKGGYPTGGGSTTGMVLNLEGKSTLNSKRRILKADGVQGRPKGIPLLATSDHHVCNELPLGGEKREEGSS